MSEKLKIVFGYILICLLWGSTWLAIRIGLDSLTPVLGAGIRFAVASIIVFGLMRLKKITIQTDKHSIKLYLIMAFFSFVIPFGLVYWGEKYIPTGLASIIFAVFPLFVILFSYLLIKESKTLVSQVIGVFLGFGGIIIIFSEGLKIDFSNDSMGMAAVFTSAVMQAGIAVIIKKYGRHLNPLSMNFLPLLIAGISMILFGILFEDFSHNKLDEKAVLSVLYLALFGTVVTFTTYYWLMQRINVFILSLSSFITPIVAVILGWFILGEQFTFQTIIGSFLVLVGILFANFSGLKKYITDKRILND